jgi:drug/metabolite transporter (DMT)-like permease
MTDHANNGPGGLGQAALVGAAALWGSSVVTTKLAARGLPTVTITLIEIATAVAVLGGLLLLRRTRLPGPSRSLVLAGILEPGLSYPLINAGLARTSGGHAALVIALESVLVVGLDAAIERTRPTRRVGAALMVTTTGVVLLTGDAGGSATVGGDLLVLAGVGGAALYVVVAQRQVATVDPLTLTFFQFLFGGLAFLPIAALAAGRPDRLLGDATTSHVAAATATGVFGSAGAFLLYNWALRRVSAAVAAISVALVPVFGIGFSAVSLDESVTVGTLAPAGTILAGLVLLWRTPTTAQGAPPAIPPAHAKCGAPSRGPAIGR